MTTSTVDLAGGLGGELGAVPVEAGTVTGGAGAVPGAVPGAEEFLNEECVKTGTLDSLFGGTGAELKGMFGLDEGGGGGEFGLLGAGVDVAGWDGGALDEVPGVQSKQML